MRWFVRLSIVSDNAEACVHPALVGCSCLMSLRKNRLYNTLKMVYDVFYVNGDNNLENLRRLDQTWTVRLIEEESKRLMFDTETILG